MSRRALLVVLLAACFPLGAGLTGGTVAAADVRPSASPSAARATKVPGKTLTVQVTGLARGHHAKITVRGPHGYAKPLSASATLRHLRSGTYRVAVAPTSAPKGARVYPVRRTTAVTVTATLGAGVRVRYLTTVPKTTKAVPAKSITKVTRLTGKQSVVSLARGTTFKTGDIIASGVSARTPHGLLAKVVTVRRGSVVVTPTTLLAAVPNGQLDAVQTLTSPNLVPDVGTRGLRRRGDAVQKKVDGPLATCSGGVKAQVSGSVSITPSFHLAASWSLLHGVTSASLTADLTQRSELAASIEAAGSCKGSRKLFAKPLTFATFVVYVGPVPIVLQPQLQITVAGKAEVQAAVSTSASQSLSVSAGLKYVRGQGVSPISSVTRKFTHKPPTLTASGTVTATVNPEITLLIDGVGGPEIGLTGGLELAADVNSNPWWTLKGFLAGNVGVTVPLLHFDKRATLGRKEWTIAHAPYSATPDIEVSDAAAPWSEDVCGFDTGSQYFDISGSGFAPGESVDISTDWTSYGTVTADGDGDFYVTEAVGEVPSTDHDLYGVTAHGETGRESYDLIELNGINCTNQTESGGEVTLQWGSNGMDPGSDLYLLIDGDYYDFATTDELGSGGSTVTFTCPDSGEYTWDVEGTNDGNESHNESGPLTRSCDPPGSGDEGLRVKARTTSVVAASG